MPFTELLLKMVANDIAKMEGQTEKHFIDAITDEQIKAAGFSVAKVKKKDFRLKVYDSGDYGKLLILLAQLAPVYEARGGQLSGFQDFIDVDLDSDWLVNTLRLIKFWSEMNEKKGIVGYGGNNEVTSRYDDRVEPRFLEAYLRQLFPDTPLSDLPVYTKVRRNMEATVMVVKKEFIEEYDDGHIIVKTRMLLHRKLEDRALHPKEAFTNQMSFFSRGTGFFLKMGNLENKYIATAAHLFWEDNQECSPKDFVYLQGVNWRLDYIERFDPQEERCEYWVKIPRSKVFYSNAKNVIQDYNNDDIDWAYFEIEPNRETQSYPVDVVEEVSAAEAKEIPKGTTVYGIGHGLGLSQKLHLDASVNYEDATSHLKCCIDFFAGNSGSPVFDSITHKAIGFMFRGIKDHVLKQDTLETNNRLCNSDGQNGESVQRLHLLQETEKKLNTIDQVENIKSGPRRTSIPAKRDYAPYLYLADEQGSTNILVFVLIPLPSGVRIDKIATPNPMVHSYQMKYSYVSDGSITAPHYFSQVHRLKGTGSFPQSGTVEIQAQFGTGANDFYRGLMRFDERDTSQALSASNDIAYNVPYLYLTNPQLQGTYYPRILIPVKDTKVKTEGPLTPDTKENKVVLIELEADNGSTIILDTFNLNSNSYSQGSGPHDRGTIIEVEYNGGKRKAKIRNTNSDEKPTRFDV